MALTMSLALKALQGLHNLGLDPADVRDAGGIDGLNGYGHALVPTVPPDGRVHLSQAGEALLRSLGCEDLDILAIREDTGEIAAAEQAVLRVLRKRKTTDDWKARNPSAQAQYQRAYRQRQKAQKKGGTTPCRTSPPADPLVAPGK